MTEKEKKERTPYDQAYKHFFTDPRMLRDVIKTFIGDELANNLDLATLERINGHYVTETLRSRSNDMVWRIRWQDKDEWLYLLIILEFQSERYHFMPVRTLTYTGLLYEHLIDEYPEIRKAKELPPVLPLVWYSGEGEWRSPVSMEELRPKSLPRTLLKYQPNIEFFLIEEGCYNVEKPTNFAEWLLKCRKAKNSDELKAYFAELSPHLKGANFRRLRRSFLILGAVQFGQYDIEGLPDFDSLDEGMSMLQNFREQALQQGVQQGVQQGRADLLSRQLARKFGDLSDEQRHALDSMEQDELLEIGDRIFDAKSFEDLIKKD